MMTRSSLDGVEEDSQRAAGGGPRRMGDLGWLLLIGSIGLGLRLAYAKAYARHPLGQYLWVDEGAYWTRARGILQGAWLPSRPFYQDPLFPYLLAVVMRAVGSDPGGLRIALACLGALTPVAITLAGWRGLGRAEGVLAGLIAAVYGPLIFADGLLEKEGPGALIAATALGLTARAFGPRRGVWAVAAAGLAWGLLALVRANALIVAPIGAIWWAWVLPRPDGGRRWSRPAPFLLGFAAALTPVTAVNLAVGKAREPILTTWQAGANFYIGNGPEASGTYMAPDFVRASPAFEADDFAAEASRRAGRRLTPSGVSRFWFGEGLRRWRVAPAESFRLLGRKLGFVLHRFEIPDNQSPEVVRLVAAPGLAWGVLGFGLLAPCAALGLARSTRVPFLGFVAATTAAGLITTAAFFVVGRYRIPWIPGLALMASAGLVELARLIAARRWPAVATRLAVLALPAAVMAWRPMADPVPDRWGHAEIELAVAWTQAGQLGPAIDALDDARALGPGPALQVREILTSGPLRTQMAALVSRWPAFEPGLALERERARRLRQFPDGRAESRRILESLLASHPDDPATLREMGAWWLGEIDDPEARGRAARDLARAAEGPLGDPSAVVLSALLTGNVRPLAQRRATDYRTRLARAILASRGRSVGSGS